MKSTTNASPADPLLFGVLWLFPTWYWPELTLWLPRYLYGD